MECAYQFLYTGGRVGLKRLRVSSYKGSNRKRLSIVIKTSAKQVRILTMIGKESIYLKDNNILRKSQLFLL